MPRVKQASKHARTTKAVAATALGTAGLGLSLGGSASANTIPTADFPQYDNIPPDQRFVLGEEEMADVSLATFHLFDKEIDRSDMQQLAVVVVRRGCGGCRGCRGGASFRKSEAEMGQGLMRASCPRHVWTALLPQYPSSLLRQLQFKKALAQRGTGCARLHF